MKCLLFLLLLAPLLAGAQNYKCTQNGRVVYTNLPCSAFNKKSANSLHVNEADDNRTAAQIQLDFERERDAEKARKAAEAASVTAKAVGALDLPVALQAPTTQTREGGGGRDWGTTIFLICLYFLPTIIAGARRHRNETAIFALNLFLGWTVAGWIIALIWGLTANVRGKPTAVLSGKDADPLPVIIDYIGDKMRQEIRVATDQQLDAMTALSALARIDGSTSEAELSIMFDFLCRNGAALDAKHRPYVTPSTIGVRLDSAHEESIQGTLVKLLKTSLQYRIDVVATATAIVACGGKAKKRELETLSRISTLVAI